MVDKQNNSMAGETSAAPSSELDSLDAELEALNSERDRIAKETTETHKVTRKRAEVETARVRVADEQLLARAEAALGIRGRDWDVVPTSLGAVVVKRANHMHYKRWQDDGMKITAVALENLVRHALFEISWKDYCKRVEDEAATLLKTASVLNRLAGVRAEDFEGK